MTMNAKERTLLLEALSRHAVHVREGIDACERDMPGLPPPKPGVLAAYREDLVLVDQLFARIQADGLGAGPSDPPPSERLVDVTTNDENKLAGAIRSQVAKFSDRRMNDGDDVWRERELELRCGVAATANAICVALGLDATTFAAACGLYVSDGRDSYSDCYPGELTWEKPRESTP